jgi:hypothetical protein
MLEDLVPMIDRRMIARRVLKGCAVLGLAVGLTACQKSASIITFAGNGSATASGDGAAATSAGVPVPSYVGADGAGNSYVDSVGGTSTNTGPSQIREVDSNGVISTLWSSPHTLEGLAVAPDGTLYVHDDQAAAILRRATDGTVSTVASMGQTYGMAVLPDGNLVVAPFGGAYVVEVATSNGAVTVLAGTGVRGSTGDGGPATLAEVSWPTAIAVGSDGAVYFSEFETTGGAKVRRIDMNYRTISTVAGTGSAWAAGDPASTSTAAVNVDLPVVFGLTIASDGSVLMSLTAENKIARVASDGTFHVVSGTGTEGLTGDGAAADAAQLTHPYGLALDKTEPAFWGTGASAAIEAG